MNKRSLFLAMVFSSLFGGMVAVVGYSIMVPPTTIVRQAANSNPVALTNYTFDSSSFVVPEGLNFVFAAKKGTASVVHIRTTYSGGNQVQNPFHNFFREYFGEQSNPRNYGPSRGAGSGVIISDDGYIVTNNHVIENAIEIEVVLNDNRSYKAEIVGVDKNTDLAVIKIKEAGLSAVSYGNSNDIQIGEWVLAIGNPFEFRSTVTAGIISAKGRNINILRGDFKIESFIQTDAAVNPGNSGGALVNLNGELIGINTAIASPSGAFAGYSFAVPATLVQKVVKDLVDYGAVQRALLGVQITDVNAELAEERDLDVVKGVFITGVQEGAAKDVGIKQGDVIIAINAETVNNVAELQEQIALNRPGDDVTVTYIRSGKRKEVTATLRNIAGTTDIVEVKNDLAFDGAVFIEVSEEIKRSLGIEGGVQLKEMKAGKWKQAGLKEGFIIIRIDRRPIGNLQDLSYFVANQSREDGILIEGYYPNGQKAYYGLGL